MWFNNHSLHYNQIIAYFKGKFDTYKCIRIVITMIYNVYQLNGKSENVWVGFVYTMYVKRIFWLINLGILPIAYFGTTGTCAKYTKINHADIYTNFIWTQM